MSQDAQYRADKAKRLMEDLEPYLTKLEKAALDAAVTNRWKSDEGGQIAIRLLERVSVIHSITGMLEAEIKLGEQAERKEAQVEPGFSPYA